MIKKSIALFFTILFVAVITAPTIIAAIDNSIDISILYSCTEEEEKESENTKTFELVYSVSGNDEIPSCTSITLNTLSYRSNDYSKPHLNLVFPPPEFI